MIIDPLSFWLGVLAAVVTIAASSFLLVITFPAEDES